MSSRWTRNYDNMFCALYGYGSLSYSAIAEPDHSRPLVRTMLGNYKTPAVVSKNTTDKSRYGVFAGLALGCQKIYLTTNNETGIYDYDGAQCAAIQIGANGTEASYDDYKLYEPHLTNLAVNNNGVKVINNGYDEATHSYSFTMKIPIVYSGSSNIEVREFGLFGCVGASDYRYPVPVLYYREVLDDVITLQPNDTIEISVTQSIVQPNYTPYPDNSTIV